MLTRAHARSGFTIVELIIVIVVIAILAAITIVSYNNMQDSAKNARVLSDIRQVGTFLQKYHAKKGSYPSTGGLTRVYTDNNCLLGVDPDGYKGPEWVPDMAGVATTLPQNPGLQGTGRASQGGCYTYASDGTVYVLSAWNAKRGGGDTDKMYRRLGWRENSFFNANNYVCNHVAIGGTSGGVYNAALDFYKFSYTISNITDCNETPPAGA